MNQQSQLKIKRSLSLISYIAMCSLLYGCVRLNVSSLQTQFQKKPALRRIDSLKKITAWQVQGAFSMRPKNQKSTIASYSWQQTGAKNFHLKIYSPFLADGLTIIGTAKQVALYQSNKAPLIAKTANQLLLNSTGWNLPIANLYYWIRGIAAPNKKNLRQQKFDRYGHLTTLQQNNWHVVFSAYQTISGIDLPRILTLTQKNLEIKIVIKQWQLNN